MTINWKRIPPVLHSISFEVVGEDRNWNPMGLIITPDIEKALELSAKAMNDFTLEHSSEQKIRQLIQQYPQVPMLKNHLFVFYYQSSRLEAAQQVINECLEAQPDYFYNGVMQSMLWIKSDADREKLPVLMRGWNIVAYAGRAKFAEHEVLSYYLTAAEYYLYSGKIELADQFIYFLEASHSNPKHKNIQNLRQKVEAIKKLPRKPPGIWVKKGR